MNLNSQKQSLRVKIRDHFNEGVGKLFRLKNILKCPIKFSGEALKDSIFLLVLTITYGVKTKILNFIELFDLFHSFARIFSFTIRHHHKNKFVELILVFI